MAGVYSILHDIVGKQIKEGSFVAGEAAKLAIDEVLALDNLSRNCIPNILPLILAGLRERAKSYVPGLNAAIAAARSDTHSRQTDFSELDTNFSRMICTPIAIDEALGTRFLPPIEMDLGQLERHCGIAERRATQTLTKVSLYRAFIAQHPEWRKNPTLKLGQILQIKALVT